MRLHEKGTTGEIITMHHSQRDELRTAMASMRSITMHGASKVSGIRGGTYRRRERGCTAARATSVPSAAIASR
jgi:hypothetical protein